MSLGPPFGLWLKLATSNIPFFTLLSLEPKGTLRTTVDIKYKKVSCPPGSAADKAENIPLSRRINFSTNKVVYSATYVF